MATLIQYKQLDLLGKIKNNDLGELILTTKLQEGADFIKRNGTVVFTANQSMGGFKLTSLANGTNPTDAINKSQLDALDVDLQTQIDNINTALTDGMKVPLPFDASTTTTFPTQPKGTTYKVTVAGVTSGVQLEVGDTIIYDTTGNTPYVVQSNLSQATEAILGTVKIATQAQVTAGADDTTAVTPLKLKNRLDTVITQINSTSDSKYVRYDASQGLTTGQQLQGRQNIGAAADSEVVKLTGNQSISGTKSFTSSPIIPTGTASNHAVNKAQLDEAILESGMENLIVNEIPTGALDGLNNEFTLANIPVTGKGILVTLNGQTLYETDDYELTGAIVSFLVAPEATDKLGVTYVKS